MFIIEIYNKIHCYCKRTLIDVVLYVVKIISDLINRKIGNMCSLYTSDFVHYPRHSLLRRSKIWETFINAFIIFKFLSDQIYFYNHTHFKH